MNNYGAPPYSRAKIYAARMSRGSSGYDRYRLRARAGAQQQTSQPPLLLSVDGTDGQMDGRTYGQTLDRFMTLTAYYAAPRVTSTHREGVPLRYLMRLPGEINLPGKY